MPAVHPDVREAAVVVAVEVAVMVDVTVTAIADPTGRTSESKFLMQWIFISSVRFHLIM